MLLVLARFLDRPASPAVSDWQNAVFLLVCTILGWGERIALAPAMRYRRMMIKNRGREKNSIRGILLQASLDLDEAPFSSRWLAQVRKLGDYRIDGFLSSIERYDDLIKQADARVASMVRESPNAMPLKSIPGIGNFSALVISSMVGDIERSTVHKTSSHTRGSPRLSGTLRM